MLDSEHIPAPLPMHKEEDVVSPDKTSEDVRQILDRLLKGIDPIDFRGGLDPSQKIHIKHFLVTVIDNLLTIAQKQGWGLSRRYDFIYLYNGQFWNRIDKDTFTGFLGRAAHKMGVPYIDAKYFSFQDQLLKQFYASAHFDSPEEKIDHVLINLQNGTFEISKDFAGLREFRMSDFLTYQLPFEFEEHTEAPIFQRYLNEVLPEEELQYILSEFMGYIFTKDLKLERCLLLQGTGANGKSVFFEIMNALLGRENVSNFSLANLAEEHNRALIADKLLNYGSEITSKMGPDMFKQIVSNEPIQCRLKYGQSFTMENYAKLCFNCNELPREVENNEAYFRRYLIVPFQVTIPEERRDPNLAKSIIAGELPGVFNWVLNGLYRLLKQHRFTPSTIVDDALNAFKLESDSVYTFIDEAQIQASTEKFYFLREIYSSYNQYTKESGAIPVKKAQFAKRLRKYGFKDERKNTGMGFYLTVGNDMANPHTVIFKEEPTLEFPF